MELKSIKQQIKQAVIIINFGKIIYDGKLATLIAMYAKEKVITVSTTQDVPKEEFEKFGAVEEYQGVMTKIRVPRAQVKSIAADIIASTLPIDDIVIDEMPVDDIIRVIFEAK